MRSRNRAFTLIEILVAVTLLAIAATVVAPQVGDSQDWIRVPSASRQVLADMLYLQNCAITTQQTVWVYFITDDNGAMAYTAATFSNAVTPAAPTYSQAVATNAGGFAGIFVPRPGSIGGAQPPVVSRLITQFGPKATPSRAIGALGLTLLKSVQMDTGAATPVSSFGFDYTGQPVDASGALINNVRIAVTNRAGTSPTYLYIHSISGEITTNAP